LQLPKPGHPFESLEISLFFPSASSRGDLEHLPEFPLSAEENIVRAIGEQFGLLKELGVMAAVERVPRIIVPPPRFLGI